MGNAKVKIGTQDRSAIVPAMSGITVGTVINSDWGPLTGWVTKPDQLLSRYGKPNNKKGSSWNGAELLLATTNKLLISRAVHPDARHAASLTRAKINPVDFNKFPAPNDTPDLIVKPIAGGILMDTIDAYAFPMYPATREYVEVKDSTAFGAQTGNKIRVTRLAGTDGKSTIAAGSFVSFSPSTKPTNESPLERVVSATIEEEVIHTVTLSAPLTGIAGTEVKLFDGETATSTVPPTFLLRDASSNSIIVSDSDHLINGSQVTFDNGVTAAVVNSKTLVNEQAHYLTFDSPVTVGATDKVYLQTQADVEYRDVFMTYAKYVGDKGKTIKHGIAASKDYPTDAFHLLVYVDGVLTENHLVSRKRMLDGFGNQMYIEDVVNSQSNWIGVVDNVAIDESVLPLVTDYGVWRKAPVDIFEATGVTTVEDVLAGDTFITVNDVSQLVIGSRIRFGTSKNEYKVLSSVSSTKTIQLDRPVIDTKFNLGTAILKFNSENNDEANGIFAGVQYSKYTRIAALSNYTIGDSYLLGEDSGKVLDAGYNNCAGGFDGSAITVFDVINAFRRISNPEKFKISILCDNGFTYPEVDIEINSIIINNIKTVAHGYLSTSFASEMAAEYVQAPIAYRNSTNLNTEHCSMFTGWVEVADPHNQTRVWVAPSIFGVISQSYVTDNFQIFSPAAGWVKGRVNGLRVTRQWDDGERDMLVDANLNPIRTREGSGLAIWGNETMYVKPSPLQLRSVAMLLIVLKYGLQDYLEYELFFDNDEDTWDRAETAINVFIRDNLADGLYAWKVAIKDIITDSDIDNRKMPIFVGLQPTMDIKTIDVGIGIFNKSVAIAY